MSTPATQDRNASVSSENGSSGNERPRRTRTPTENKARTQAEAIVQLAGTRFRMVRDMQGECYAVRRFAPYTAFRIKSAESRAVLAHEYRKAFRSTARAKAIDEAVSELGGEALAADKSPIHVRIAPHGPGFVLDLGRDDGVVVVAEPEGWKLTKDSPVTFKRNDFTHPMQNPERGSSFVLLRKHFRIAAGDFDLLPGYLVSVLFPQRPRPILLLQGGQGTGKSTVATMIVSILDPSEAPLHSPPRHVDSWIDVASSVSLVVIDNLSDVPVWLSDALCRSTSGDAIIKRVLYTDADLHVRRVRASVILTTIEPGALRGDLGDRVLQLVLEPFPPGERRELLEVVTDLASDAPKILGAILDAACAVMRRWKSLNLRDLPRMADFAKILAAMDEEYGTQSLPRYLEKRKSFAADIAFSDPVVAAVASFMDQRRSYDATATELLPLLETHGLGSDGNRRWIPATLGKALARANDSLRAIGIECSRDKVTSGRERRVHLRKTAQTPVRAVQPSEDAPTVPDSADSSDRRSPTTGGYEKAREMIDGYARTGTLLFDDLIRYFEERVANSDEPQALLDLVDEIKRRRQRSRAR